VLSLLKIVIVGIGGVGGIIGGKLAQYDSKSVNFFCRGETLGKLLSNGLEFRSNNSSIIIRPSIATNDPYKIGKADVIIFAVKNYSLECAAKEIAHIVSNETVIIPLLNGLAAEQKLKVIYNESDLLGGCIYVSAFVVSPGIVQQNGNVLKLLFGNSNLSEEENLKKYSCIRDIFAAAGINTVLTSNIENEMWTKFIMISSLATATSVYMRNIGELFSAKDSFDMFKGLVSEIVTVAKAKGVVLPENIEEETLKKSSSFTPETKTSMQLDFEKGNANELEALTGYVCNEANKLGIDIPLFNMAYDKLKYMT
jgi:2-dehydropantoate 2-reductase